jgi:thiamine kinase-like enzyme
MDIPIYQEALAASANQPDYVVKPITNGLINHTYKVVNPVNGVKFLLQQINQDVFREPEKVQNNYIKIWEILYFEQAPKNIPFPVSIPEPIRFKDDNMLFCDSQNHYWRMFEFIENAHTIHTAENSTQAKKVAQTFACLTASFEFYNYRYIDITIPSFHDLALRFLQFKQSLHSKKYDRLLNAAPLIDQLKKRERYVSFFEVMTGSNEFEKRLMHHDAKISNILFDEETGKVICPVDFDTCMPGYFFSDLGDMIRSMTSSEGESSVNYDAINIRKDIYEAITDGYMEVMQKLLTDSEKKFIHSAGLLIIYMQTLRFLADYLNGDLYYKTTYPGQNFDRAMNQLTLLQRLEEFLSAEYQFKF